MGRRMVGSFLRLLCLIIPRSDRVEAYVAFSALCQASHVFKPAAPPPLSNPVAKVAKSSTIHSTGRPNVAICLRLVLDNLLYASESRRRAWHRAETATYASTGKASARPVYSRYQGPVQRLLDAAADFAVLITSRSVNEAHGVFESTDLSE